MRIVLAPDSFKECLSAPAVCDALARGIRAALPCATIVSIPLADGGEGTLDVVLHAISGAEKRNAHVTNPLGDSIVADYAIVPDRGIAYIEAATACGLPLIDVNARNPMIASTYGVGQLFREAVSGGARQVFVGIGGTATVDGGAGFARALGYRLLDSDGRELPDGGGALARLATIVPPDEQWWQDVDVVVASDVDNPLLGDSGAARVFGPQKGATPAMVERLETGLMQWSTVVEAEFGHGHVRSPGSGAAGGLGFALRTLCNATIDSGIDAVFKLVDFEAQIQNAALILTGEGQTDTQTLHGKVCAGVASVAHEYKIPCVVLSGQTQGNWERYAEIGMTSVMSISRGPQTLAAAYMSAADDLTQAAASAVRLFTAR